MNEKKYTKKDLYISFVLVAISFLLLLGATIAWFAMNKELESGGMEIKVNVSPTLVIGSDEEGIFKKETVVTNGKFDTSDELPYRLRPATHDNPEEYGGVKAYDDDGKGIGLVYNINPKTIDYKDGLETSLGAAKFQAVPEYSSESGKRYYMDYDVYIASDVKEMHVSQFNATLGPTPTPSDPDYFSAASVDFYVGKFSEGDPVTKGAFVGTLNLAGKGKNSKGEDVGQVLDLTGDATETIIPYIGDNNELLLTNCLHVLMRFYFDGALEKESGQAYVYSKDLSVEDFHIGVLFDAVEIKTEEPTT